MGLEDVEPAQHQNVRHHLAAQHRGAADIKPVGSVVPHIHVDRERAAGLLVEIAGERRGGDGACAARRERAPIGENIACAEIDKVAGIEQAAMQIVEGVDSTAKLDIAGVSCRCVSSKRGLAACVIPSNFSTDRFFMLDIYDRDCRRQQANTLVLLQNPAPRASLWRPFPNALATSDRPTKTLPRECRRVVWKSL